MKRPVQQSRVLSRRALLLGGVAAVTACSGPIADVGEPAVKVTSTPAPTAPPTPALYEPPAGEQLPKFKRLAGRFAQTLATYDASGRPAPPQRPPDYIGSEPALAAAAAPLILSDRWSRAEVEFVQYGGLTPVSPAATSGVAMVVLRQVLQSRDGDSLVVRRTLDLRLRQQQGAWRVTELASAGGPPVSPPARLPTAARQVLDDRRIDLPDSARWDIYSGQISEHLLRVMLRLADVTPLRATVLKTGHPQRVVDGRTAAPVSAHWSGRAVDINALGVVPIADSPPALVRSVVEAAGALQEVAQIGAPPGLDLDGGGRRWFTNLVHADHLHVAVRDLST